jgi:single-strand DNA-binding protein
MFRTDVIGLLGKDAVVNEVNGKKVINFNLAHTEKYKDQLGQEQTRTTWLHCNWWTEKTNISALLKKGQKVFVSGKPEAKVYTNNDGENQAQIHLRVNSVYLV